MIALSVAVLIIAMLAVSYVFLVMPRVTDGADMDLQSTDYAYHGLWDEHTPRCSFKAFENTRSLGFGISFPVALTADKRLVVAAKNAPTLAELLSLVDGHVPLLIEIPPLQKSNRLCKSLCLMLDGYSGAFAIMSEDVRVLTFFKKYRPRYARGQMLSRRKNKGDTRTALFLKRHLFTNVITRPDFIVTESYLSKEPAFLLATKLFCRRGFIRNVKNEKQYSYCRKHSLYTLFERIRPQ